MNSIEYKNLQEAYLEVYIPEESMPPRRSKEELKKRAKELGDRQTIRNVVGKYNKGKSPSKQENSDKYYPKEQVDIYDIILSHLLDEGYADTLENAETIMVNMSEDWREEIVEKFVSPFKSKVSYNNPQGLSPAMKASHKSDDLQRTEPGSKRQKKQTQRSQQLDRMYHSAKTSHLP